MSLLYDFSIYPRNVHVIKRLPDSTMKSHSAIRNSFKFGHQSALKPWTVCLLYRSLLYRAKLTLPIPPTARPEPLPRPNLPCAGVNNIPCAWARRSNRCHRYAHCSLDCLSYDFCSKKEAFLARYGSSDLCLLVDLGRNAYDDKTSRLLTESGDSICVWHMCSKKNNIIECQRREY